MKLYISLIITALFLAFLSGYYGLSWRGNNQATPSDIVNVVQTKVHFHQVTRPKAILNISKLFENSDFTELLSPISNLSDYQIQNARSKYSSNKDCFTNVLTLINSLKEKKVLLWEEFRCSVRKSLPDSFFSKVPYMHPSGVSYAFLAYLSKKESYHSREWLQNHLTYLHVSELNLAKQILGGLPLGLDIMSDFDEQSMKLLISGKDYFLTNKYFFARNLTSLNPLSLEFALYPKEELVEFLKRSPFELLKYNKGHDCFYRDGPYCWRYTTGYLLKHSDKANLVFAIVCLTLVLLLSWILFYKIRQQKDEDEKKRLALRVLTHEFRTPISSMLLQMERVQRVFSDLNQDLQESFLRLSNDVYRLQRLTESSRNYLHAQNRKNYFLERPNHCESVNDFVQNIVESFDEDVDVEYLDEDSPFAMDIYWVGLILRNLIENALNHGKPPVKVKLYFQKKNLLCVSIEDQGECSFNSFSEMAQEFVKGQNSKGSGLGMNIVKNALKKINGSIEFKKNPTRFRVKIPAAKIKETKYE